ncbi:hypothetical protein A2V80_00840 [Candidatus Woesebacteria bacterium RBG_16_39_8b]|uniref:Uncharacterized protein n=1 Tax=Candidatus Woesebacteria bacterium RBG_16_39_8b TaxID=1802482 RepID=A0A1F7XBX9_9BACT|nr:MAG: hypothetical protein A2V80_00840 [Candidatus Woesebacteria bacterium RBG_16_39_8b]
MSNYPEQADVFTDKSPNNNISSSDPNTAYDAIEATQGLLGALGKSQAWSTTLMTVLRQYRHGMNLEVSGGNLLVRAGEAVLESSDGSKFAYRRNPSDVTVGIGNIDVGAVAIATYYLYAKGGSAATTAPIIFSTDANYPSGAVTGTWPYRKLGWFMNAAAGAMAVTYAVNYDLMYNSESAIKAWVHFDGTSAGTVTPGYAAIKAQFNVASVAYDADGQYTITWIKAFSNAFYVIAGWAAGAGQHTFVSGKTFNDDFTAASCKIEVTNEVNELIAANIVTIIALGV